MKIPLYLKELRKGVKEQETMIAKLASEMPLLGSATAIQARARTIVGAYELRNELQGKAQAIETALAQVANGITEEE